MLRHDVRTDEFPAGSFDLVHARAVVMHIANRMATLRRMVSWLAPGGWLLVEEPDFGMWMTDFDPVWAAHPRAWHEAFPHGSVWQGRAILRQIHRLGLDDIGADADLDIVRPGTALAEFYRLSMAAMAEPLTAAGVLTAAEAAAVVARLDEPDFLGCGFAFIGPGDVAPASPGARADLPGPAGQEDLAAAGQLRADRAPHVPAVLAKIGVSSGTAAAREAARTGIAAPAK